MPKPREAIAGRRDASHVVEPANRDEGGQVERSTFVMHLDVEWWKAITRTNGGAEGVMEPREETEEEVVVEMEGARRGSLAPRTADGAPATTGHPESAAEEEEEEEEENAAAAGTRRVEPVLLVAVGDLARVRMSPVFTLHPVRELDAAGDDARLVGAVEARTSTPARRGAWGRANISTSRAK